MSRFPLWTVLVITPFRCRGGAMSTSRMGLLFEWPVAFFCWIAVTPVERIGRRKNLRVAWAALILKARRRASETHLFNFTPLLLTRAAAGNLFEVGIILPAELEPLEGVCLSAESAAKT